MMTKTIAMAAAVTGLALTSGCGDHPDRTTSVPRGADQVAVLRGIDGPTGFSAPPAPPERGPIPPNAITVAPGTDAEAAFANSAAVKTEVALPGNDARLAVAAQDAAARAPDTAAADAAKKAVIEGRAPDAGATSPASAGATARDTPANSPRHGTLTPGQENTEMPKAGQANNHSSTALEKDSGR